MDVEVVVIGPGGVTKLVAHTVSGIFQNMNKMGVLKHRESTKDAAFIYGFKEALQLHQ